MPESTPIAISVRNVTFGYTRHDTVLDHVGFGVPHGQSLAVLGYNGVGKHCSASSPVCCGRVPVKRSSTPTSSTACATYSCCPRTARSPCS